MKTEDYNAMKRDICGRLPYGPMFHYYYGFADGEGEDFDDSLAAFDIANDEVFGDVHHEPMYMSDIQLYLRPLSDMREDEVKKLDEIEPGAICYRNYDSEKIVSIRIVDDANERGVDLDMFERVTDYLNSIHIDWRGLIGKHLALSATKEEIEELEHNYDK